MRGSFAWTLIALACATATPLSLAQGRAGTPITSAADTAWYRSGAPIPIGDALYYPAGPITFFDANTMVLSGLYNGVPIFTDTTREPLSFVLVPIGGGQMRPYERRRTGELAGTTGSTAPGMPVGMASATVRRPLEAPGPPMRPMVGPLEPLNGPALPAAVSPEREPVAAPPAGPAVGTTGRTTPSEAYVPGHVVVTTQRPESNDGIWVRFAGAKWVAAGVAVPLDPGQFAAIGQYAGFPVFAREGERHPRVIYLPSRPGLVAPYRRK